MNDDDLTTECLVCGRENCELSEYDCLIATGPLSVAEREEPERITAEDIDWGSR